MPKVTSEVPEGFEEVARQLEQTLQRAQQEDPGAAKRAQKKHQKPLDTESRQRALGLLAAAELRKSRR